VSLNVIIESVKTLVAKKSDALSLSLFDILGVVSVVLTKGLLYLWCRKVLLLLLLLMMMMMMMMMMMTMMMMTMIAPIPPITKSLVQVPSSAAQAQAEDHRNDIGGNVLSVAAVLLAFYVAGLWWVDATVAMVRARRGGRLSSCKNHARDANRVSLVLKQAINAARPCVARAAKTSRLQSHMQLLPESLTAILGLQLLHHQDVGRHRPRPRPGLSTFKPLICFFSHISATGARRARRDAAGAFRTGIVL
jgi:hypothetical protein